MLIPALAAQPPVLRIINGEPATADDYPMAGALLVEVDGNSGGWAMPMLWCSSTLIAPDVVLLAAHCVDTEIIAQTFPGTRQVRMYWTRQADLTDYDGTGAGGIVPDDAVEAWGWVQHSGYDYWSMAGGVSINHDIAVLFLSAAVTSAPYAYLPSVEESAQVVEGAEVVVVGWGQQGAAPDSDFATKEMGTSQIDELGTHELLVGASESDVRQCFGDSGGPVLMEVSTDTPERLRLIGLTSHSYDNTDCQTTGGVSTRTDTYRDWIDTQLRAYCANGLRVWCEQDGVIDAPEADEDTDSSSGDGSVGGISPQPGNGNSTQIEPDASGCGGGAGLVALLLGLPRRRSASRMARRRGGYATL